MWTALLPGVMGRYVSQSGQVVDWIRRLALFVRQIGRAYRLLVCSWQPVFATSLARSCDGPTRVALVERSWWIETGQRENFMIEIVTTAIITGSSVILFAYWFRYTCLLILTAKPIRDYAGEIAEANQLGFRQVQSQLPQAASGDLDRLRDSLDRDYAVIASLLRNVEKEPIIEKHMLAINYRLMSAWYGLSSRFSTQVARQALQEMSSVVAHFAGSIGEQAACGSAA
jgi:hypothetical protein